jgi:hypothetical protein
LDNKTAKRIRTGEIGRSGTIITNGIISNEELNRKLVGQSGLRVLDNMRRTDPTIRASLRMIKLPLLQADKRLEAGDQEDETSLYQRDFVWNEIQKIDLKRFLSEATTFLDMGFAVFENCYTPTKFQGQTLIGLDKLAFRKQTTIQAWQTDDQKLGVRQQLIDGNVSIPMEKLTIFTNDKEGDNYEGVSILRSAYKPWYIMDTLEKIDAMAAERHGLGTIRIKPPSTASEPDKEKAQEVARQLRANEESYVQVPDDWEFEFMDMHGGGLRDLSPSIERQRNSILLNVLGQFLLLGSAGSTGGGRAMSEDHSRLFEMSIQYYAEYIASVINKQIIKPLIDLNFSDVEVYPEFSFGKISDDDITKLADAYQKFIGAGVLTPDADMEQNIRDILKTNEMPEEIREAYQAKLGNAIELAKNPPPAIAPTAPAPDPKADEPASKKASDLVEQARQFTEHLKASYEILSETD